MKKKIYFSIILLLVGVILINFNKKRYIYYDRNITLAINVDGNKRNSIPSKGHYEVLVDCGSTGIGRWDYDLWKLDVANASNPVKCDVNFNSFNAVDKKFSDKISSLAQTPSSDFDWINSGMVVEEHASIMPKEEYITYDYSDYLNVSDVSSMFEFANGSWTSKMTSKVTSSLEFNLSKDGLYQLCYNIPAGSYSNVMRYYINDSTNYTSKAGSSGSDVSGCNDLWVMSSNSKIKVSITYYNKNTSFYLKYSPIYDITSEYRYEGKNVNNYVWYNNELWRIIGVFDEYTHGISGQNLVKIMKAESIGGLSWDARGEDGKTYDANWAESSLNILLNEYYYKQRNNDDTLGNVSAYCHTYNNSISGSCDYSVAGISDAYRNMIEANAKWYIKIVSSYSNSKEVYDYERKGTNKSNDFPDYVEKPVGLMYVSDYGYSAGRTCIDTNVSYYNSGCATKSWIYGNGYEWTITPSSSTYLYASSIDNVGYVTNRNLYFGYQVRPSVYLKADTYFYQGDGSINNPYIIGIN